MTSGWRGLLGWIRAWWLGFAVGTVFHVLGLVAGDVLLALNVRYLMDAFDRTSWPLFYLAVAGLLILVLFGPLLMGFSKYFFGLSVQRVLRDVRRRLFGAGLGAGELYYDTHRTADVGSHMVNDANRLGETLEGEIPTLTSAVLGLLVSLCLLYYWDVLIALLVMVMTALGFYVNSRFSAAVSRVTEAEQGAMAEVMGSGSALGSGLLVLKSLRAESRYLDWFAEKVSLHRAAVLQRGRVQAGMRIARGLTSDLYYSVLLLVAGRMAVGDLMTPGTAAGIAQLGSQVISPATRLAQAWSRLHRGIAISDRVHTVLRASTRGRQTRVGDAPHIHDASIQLQGVSFSYPSSPPVVDMVSLGAQDGEVVALVGESGSGKSTILRILLGLYPGYTGEIRVGGCTVNPADHWDRLRPVFSLCPQNLGIFARSVRENLIMALSPDPNGSGSLNTLRRRHPDIFEAFAFDSLLSELQNGLSTPASQLSGGQKQRLALLRAFLKPAPVVLLDEPTSHLDESNEAMIYRAIRTAGSDRTVMMATHRVTDLDWVDRIFVMERGTVVEQGSFSELLTRGGHFASLYDSQLPTAGDKSPRT